MGPADDGLSEFEAQNEAPQDATFLGNQEVVDYVPTVNPMTRTVVYVVGLAVAFLSFVVAGSAPVLMDDPTAVVTIAGLVGSGFGTLAAGLGVAYRPTK